MSEWNMAQLGRIVAIEERLERIERKLNMIILMMEREPFHYGCRVEKEMQEAGVYDNIRGMGDYIKVSKGE